MRKLKSLLYTLYSNCKFNFFPALKAELENENVLVQVLNLPNSMHPVFTDELFKKRNSHRMKIPFLLVIV